MIENGPPAIREIEVEETRGLYDDLRGTVLNIKEYQDALANPDPTWPNGVTVFTRGTGASLETVTVDDCPQARDPWINVSIGGADGLLLATRIRTHPVNVIGAPRLPTLVTYELAEGGRPKVDEWNTRAAVTGSKQVRTRLMTPPQHVRL